MKLADRRVVKGALVLAALAASTPLWAQTLVAAAPTLAPAYAAREATAPAAVRTLLAGLRANIAAKKLRYVVGYTGALERPRDQLLGLVLPPDLDARIAARRKVQAAVLAADDRASAAYVAAHAGAKPPAAPTFDPAAKRFDYREYGVVEAIHDQRNCGACWAFATVGALEASYHLRFGAAPAIDTAEQEVLSCSGGSCKGGFLDRAATWLTYNGLPPEADAPYQAMVTPCDGKLGPIHVGAWGWAGATAHTTTAEMKLAITTFGPIAVSVQATDAFIAYGGGVYDEPFPADSDDGNHAVVLVGWDDALGAFIVRNSWGTTWGETAGHGSQAGYMYLAYGSSNVGRAAIWVRAADPRFPPQADPATVNAKLGVQPVQPTPGPTPIHAGASR